MKIYFDMDGVLADFDVAAQAIDGQAGAFNQQTKTMTAAARAAKQMRWRRIEEKKDFWANIPVLAGARDMLRVAAKIGELFVLTKVPGAKNFVAGDAYVDFVEAQKREWIARYLADFFDDAHVIVARIPKEELLHPGTTDLLIDDRDGNIADWCAAGGRGIVFHDAGGVIKDLTSGTF